MMNADQGDDSTSARKGEKLSWRFPRMFWIANGAELFERAAFYGMFIALAVYLTREIGFTDVQTGWVAALFACVLYLLPTFMGVMADTIGFRRALMLAFALLTAGYFLLGAAPEAARFLPGAYSVKAAAIVALALIMVGGAIIKPVISGTVAQCSDDAHRARAFSIFYAVVNIGAFTGKFVAGYLREELGLQYINYYAAVMALLALIWVALFYRDADTKGTGKTLDDALRGLGKVLRNRRFMALILIVAGFWTIQAQLYATLSKYLLRLMGEGAKPEWLANINPFVVILLVVPITHVVRRFKPENAIGIGLFIISVSAMCVGLGTVFDCVVGMLIVGIALQGVAECFLSPKFLEYASKQAPPGEVGLYMGYQHLTTSIAWPIAFVLSGYLFESLCPDPRLLSPEDFAQWKMAVETGSRLPEAYAHAHWMWFAFSAVGVLAFIGLWIFKYVTSRIDRAGGHEPTQTA